MYARRGKRHFKFGVFLFILIIIAFVISSAVFFRDLTCSIAVSDAADIVTATVNEAVSGVFRDNDYDTGYFVDVIQNADGLICGIAGNTAHINKLSADVLSSVIASTDNGKLRVQVPAGNLSGINLLMGKGPDVTVDIVMLTSSHVDFKDNISSCGINQTKYQLMLEICIDIDVLVPWGTRSTQTLTEVIVADTVIVGNVPETYLNWEK